MGWLISQAWTSHVPVGGYRHFQVIAQGGRGQTRWVELSAILNRAYREKLSWKELKDRRYWSSGWQQIPAEEEDMSSSP